MAPASLGGGIGKERAAVADETAGGLHLGEHAPAAVLEQEIEPAPAVLHLAGEDASAVQAGDAARPKSRFEDAVRERGHEGEPAAARAHEHEVVARLSVLSGSGSEEEGRARREQAEEPAGIATRHLDATSPQPG